MAMVMPPTFMNLFINLDCKFHGDVKYKNEDIVSKLDKTMEDYKKFCVPCPALDEMKTYYDKFKDSIVESVTDGLKLIDRNHSSYMMVVFKNFKIRLIKCTDWVINEEEKQIIKPGMWGF